MSTKKSPADPSAEAPQDPGKTSAEAAPALCRVRVLKNRALVDGYFCLKGSLRICSVAEAKNLESLGLAEIVGA